MHTPLDTTVEVTTKYYFDRNTITKMGYVFQGNRWLHVKNGNEEHADWFIAGMRDLKLEMHGMEHHMGEHFAGLREHVDERLGAFDRRLDRIEAWLPPPAEE